MDSKKRMWFHVGMEFEFTDDELRRMRNHDSSPFLEKIAANDFVIQGVTYAPVEEYNEEAYAVIPIEEETGWETDEIIFWFEGGRWIFKEDFNYV